MKAAMHDVYGDASVVTIRDAAVPEPAAGEGLIRVRAAGLDRGVWHLLTGTPLMARLALGLRTPRQKMLGLDVAGVVERVGAGVTEFLSLIHISRSSRPSWVKTSNPVAVSSSATPRTFASSTFRRVE